MMDDYRRDSVYLDFSGMPTRPKLEKVHELISKKIQLDMAKVTCIQPSMTKARVIIELKSQQYVEQLVAEHSEKHTVELNNKQYAIPIVPYDNAIEVRVADLPSYFSTETIAKHLAPYGEVLSTQVELWKNFWPGLPTGVRLARMRIKKPIPSYIPMSTHTAYITYRNQIRTCRYCVRPLHIGRTCNEARIEQGHDINSRLTAAQVVQGIIPTLPSTSQATAPPPSSNHNNMETKMETSHNETEHSAHKTPNIETLDRQMETDPNPNQSSRTSSLSRHPLGESIEIDGSSRASSPSSTKGEGDHNYVTEFLISDDGEEAPKRHRLQQFSSTSEAPFQEVKRKSRSNTKNSSSR